MVMLKLTMIIVMMIEVWLWWAIISENNNKNDDHNNNDIDRASHWIQIRTIWQLAICTQGANLNSTHSATSALPKTELTTISPVVFFSNALQNFLAMTQPTRRLPITIHKVLQSIENSRRYHRDVKVSRSKTGRVQFPIMQKPCAEKRITSFRNRSATVMVQGRHNCLFRPRRNVFKYLRFRMRLRGVRICERLKTCKFKLLTLLEILTFLYACAGYGVVSLIVVFCRRRK